MSLRRGIVASFADKYVSQMVQLATLAVIIVFGLITMINPNYMGEFFVDQRLIVAGIGGLIWMSLGAFIMAKMVSFEI